MRRLALGGVALALACSGPRPSVHVPSVDARPPSPVRRVSAAHYHPIHPLALEGGARGVLSNGVRIVLSDSGTRTLDDREPLEAVTQIPSELGGGYLFTARTGTLFSPRFDGAPVLISDVRAFEVGYRSVLFLTETRVMKELPSGRDVSLPLPKLTDIVVHPARYALAQTEDGDIYFSPDVSRPSPWRKLLSARGGGVTTDGTDLYYGEWPPKRDDTAVPTWIAVDARGHAGHVYAGGAYPGPTPPAPANPLDRLFRYDVYTAAMSRDAAVTIEGLGIDGIPMGDGALVLLDARTGQQKRRIAFDHLPCFLVASGTPTLLRCHDVGGLSLWRIDSPGADPVVDRKFADGVWFDRADAGELPVGTEIPLPVDPMAPRHAPTALHLRHGDGRWEKVPVPADIVAALSGVETKWLARPDGKIVGVGRKEGEWLLVDPRGDRVAHVLSNDSFRELSKPWLDRTGDSVRFFAHTQGHDQHALLELGFDGKVRYAELPTSVTGAGSARMGPLGVAGSRALLGLSDGVLLETLDFGRSWHQVDPPPGGGAAREIRCFEAGCTIDGFYRVGWGYE